MRFRQITTVLLFLLAAVFMKNALSDSSEPVNSLDRVTAADENHEVLAVLTPKFIWSDTSNATTKPLNPQGNAEPPAGLPGPLIALVVTALSLVSVARRTAL